MRKRCVTPHRAGCFLIDHHYQVIELDPLSPWGYERKHAALHKKGDYQGAVSAYEEMLSTMSKSSDPEIRGEVINVILRSIC